MTNTEPPSSNPPPQPDEMSLKLPQECGTDSYYSSTVSTLFEQMQYSYFTSRAYVAAS